MFQTTNQIMSSVVMVIDVFPPELTGITFPDLNHLNHLCKSSGITEPEQWQLRTTTHHSDPHSLDWFSENLNRKPSIFP